MADCLATIRGLPNVPEVNVRGSSGTKHPLAFKIPVGTTGCRVLEVRPDDEQKALQNKVYQWFRLSFPNGQIGWVRDDLLDIEGDGSAFGYGVLAAKRYAFEPTRQEIAALGAAVGEVVAAAQAAVQTTQTTQTTAQAAAPATSAAANASPELYNAERARRAAFNITAAFEGSGYAAYQNYDQGIVSYGRFQFTLQSGSLFSVLERYLAASNSQTANDLRGYAARIQSRDESLRNDTRLKELLLRAAQEPPMQAAQDQIATEKYWNLVQDLSIKPRGIRTPLGQALIFDMSIQHGPRHNMLAEAEKAVGVPPKSVVGQNGATEEQVISKLAEVRSDNLHKLAEKMKLPGLKPRGDFWVTLTQRGDWFLQGNSQGLITVVIGRDVQVKNP